MNDMEKMETVTQIFLVVYVVMKWLMKMKQFIVRVVASNGTTVTVLVWASQPMICSLQKTRQNGHVTPALHQKPFQLLKWSQETNLQNNNVHVCCHWFVLPCCDHVCNNYIIDYHNKKLALHVFSKFACTVCSSGIKTEIKWNYVTKYYTPTETPQLSTHLWLWKAILFPVWKVRDLSSWQTHISMNECFLIQLWTLCFRRQSSYLIDQIWTLLPETVLIAESNILIHSVRCGQVKKIWIAGTDHPQLSKPLSCSKRCLDISENWVQISEIIIKQHIPLAHYYILVLVSLAIA